jgi:hypothetical protein
VPIDGGSLCISVHPEEESHLDWNTKAPNRLERATYNASHRLVDLHYKALI